MHFILLDALGKASITTDVPDAVLGESCTDRLPEKTAPEGRRFS